MLDAHQLNVFLVAAETLNFTQAAQRLHMSQPSVSQHIQALERHFNSDLFTRSGRTLQLSDAGLTLIPLARDLVKQSIRIEETMSSLQGDVFGHLLVGCSTTPGKYVLPQLLASFHHRYPKVKVTCQVSPQLQAVEKLCKGEIHFALTSIDHKSYGEAEFRKFMRDTIILIAPLDHAWAKRETIQPIDLYNNLFIMREEDSGTYIASREALSKLGISISELQTLLTLGNSEAITLSVEEGLGVGFVSSTVVNKLGHDRIAPIKVSGLDIKRDIYIGRHTRRPATKAQKAFWDFIISLDLPITDQLIITN
jgi:DNA-binding transcriptional LysR family regulator